MRREVPVWLAVVVIVVVLVIIGLVYWRTGRGRAGEGEWAKPPATHGATAPTTPTPEKSR
ncbi:MAG: hypothetical protein C4295_08580 [Candidatus Fervidibacterota bacterium]